MEANWTQTIKTHLAEVPPGTLVEVSPNGEEHPHPPAPHWTGRGRLVLFILVITWHVP